MVRLTQDSADIFPLSQEAGGIRNLNDWFGSRSVYTRFPFIAKTEHSLIQRSGRGIKGGPFLEFHKGVSFSRLRPYTQFQQIRLEQFMIEGLQDRRSLGRVGNACLQIQDQIFEKFTAEILNTHQAKEGAIVGGA